MNLYRTYSSEGKFIERDGVQYEEAIDPEDSDRTYVETDNLIPHEEEADESTDEPAEE